MTDQVDIADLRAKLAAQKTQTSGVPVAADRAYARWVLEAAAVNALPALLDEIERLRAVTDEQVLAALNATVKPESAAPDLSYWGEESAAQMRRSLEAARQAGGNRG